MSPVGTWNILGPVGLEAARIWFPGELGKRLPESGSLGSWVRGCQSGSLGSWARGCQSLVPWGVGLEAAKVWFPGGLG